MGLILCDSKDISNPLYINELGINIYSHEELCYVIVNFPYISLDGLVNDDFLRFVNVELKLPVQSAGNDDILFSVLHYSDYYSYEETEHFRETVNELRKLKEYIFYEKKGDFLFSVHKYGKAIIYYKNALKESSFSKTDDSFKAEIWKKLGCCYANQFEFDIAFDCFKNSYELNKDNNILKYVYFLTKQQTNISSIQNYFGFLDDRVDQAWDNEYERALSESESCRELNEFKQITDTDSVRRHKALEKTIYKYKSEYRTML